MSHENNSLTQEEQLTIYSYNATAQDWADAHSKSGFWENELKKFHELLPSGSIFEIGCGGGRDAESLIDLGYKYTGTDAASGFIKVARKRNPSGIFEVANVHDLPFEENAFDGFWASAVLLHISKERINAALKKLHDITKQNGIGFISIKEGDGEHIKTEISTDGNSYDRFWAFYSDNEFRQKLAENNFEVLDFIYKPMSERTKWLIYFVKVVKE